jgi:hypothetical protein
MTKNKTIAEILETNYRLANSSRKLIAYSDKSGEIARETSARAKASSTQAKAFLVRSNICLGIIKPRLCPHH